MTAAPPRSIAITVACAFAGLSAIQAVSIAYGPQVRSTAAQARAPWMPTFLLATAVLALVFLVALWRLRRWGFYGYVATIVSQNAAWLSIGLWHPRVIVMPLLVVGATVWAWDRLR